MGTKQPNRTRPGLWGLRRYDPVTECWNWIGYRTKDKNGNLRYGQIKYFGRMSVFTDWPRTCGRDLISRPNYKFSTLATTRRASIRSISLSEHRSKIFTTQWLRADSIIAFVIKVKPTARTVIRSLALMYAYG
jgi:hypothetical protein